jgi:hypothetical protein
VTEHNVVVWTIYLVAVVVTFQTVVLFFTSKPFSPWVLALGLIAVAAIVLAIFAATGDLHVATSTVPFILLAFIVLWGLTMKQRQLRHKLN